MPADFEGVLYILVDEAGYSPLTHPQLSRVTRAGRPGSRVERYHIWLSTHLNSLWRRLNWGSKYTST
ncbi:hypothetical protein [Pyrodictium occultum]|uniref:hypothetical protein n=1 Tax=Pyrodictium occultum TaxID=2309 RepID=UPI001442E7FD|nr:hypothetical protein [Pyrodictium occultum]